MPRNDPPEVKMQKTLQVLGVVNLILSPLLLIDSRLALTAGLIVNGLLISQLHEIGKKRRPGSNLLNQGRTYFSGMFFAQNSSNDHVGEVDNALRNIINGGGAIHDEITTAFSNRGPNG
ncbi:MULTISPECIES: hypothetical protein [Legionella]|uniref:Uncharacterized protein n=1 Tax=Legionella resiliens TaxID=2905958 RepID=A0ABS8X145_9GAMM|nr:MULTISPECIES: hypothetical protein [unclassified Legionella]MCE0722543.1 hypothetical protein [Legionella sp. 9fVS26]MCE3531697.1 hypothetical protein [Legionella sp. 8cVS16]QLZ67722.1 hypothetical protein FOLKNPGA_00495 [Legionella sp. PC1000]